LVPLKKQDRLVVFEKKELRRIFGLRGSGVGMEKTTKRVP
jgi:hypothetical protein